MQSEGAWEFSVWAPNANSVAVHLFEGTKERLIPMTKDQKGYHRVVANGLNRHSRYLYRLDDSEEFPDPASRFQPDGVHQPSEIVHLTEFDWTDSSSKSPTLDQSIFYELHVGAYSKEGTLDGLIPYLPELVDLGITTVELMPVAQFPGKHNWGYDGVYPFAVQNSYGGPFALQRFVNAAHHHGLAVALDVVYNHLGPEGNYLKKFGPYLTNRYGTPWGESINFDGPDSDPVRQFFIENALYWFDLFHIDVLRLDAVHSILDFGAFHFLAELQVAVEQLGEKLGRRLYLIAESDLNDSRLIRPREQGGYALPSQWADDFHHSVHTLLTHEKGGYYADFGSVSDLATILRKGWLYEGQYSQYRRRRHGNSTEGLSPIHFVVCNQNHDQIGNRALGERLSVLVNFASQKLAAGVTLLSPFIPLLFMGEEYGEIAPFQYFTSHGDKDLIEAVRRGRSREFAEAGWTGEPPDPQSDSTFEASRLHHELQQRSPYSLLRLFYQELIRFRRDHHLGSCADLEVTEIQGSHALIIARKSADSSLLMFFNFGDVDAEVPAAIPAGDWGAALNSDDPRWLGRAKLEKEIAHSGDAILIAAQSFVIFGRINREAI